MRRRCIRFLLLLGVGRAPHPVTGVGVGVVQRLTCGHGQANGLADLDEVPDAGFVDLVEWRLVQAREQEHAAVGIGILHEPVRLLDMTAAGNDPVVFHKDYLRLLGGFTDIEGVFRRARRGVGRERGVAYEDVRLGVDTGRRHLTREKERVAVGRVSVDAGGDAGGFHEGDMRLDLAGGGTHACFLATLEVDDAEVVGLHEAFTDQRRRAEHEVARDADADVASIAVDVVAVPEAAAHVADAVLEHGEHVRAEEFFYLLRRDGVVCGPVELVVRQGGFDAPRGIVHVSIVNV